MTIQLFSDKLRESLEEQISALERHSNNLIRIAQVVNAIRNAILQLKAFTAAYKFSDDPEEIQFFKRTKPYLVSLYLFHRKLFALALFDSFRDQAARTANYHALLNRLERYTLKNQQLYEYWITGSVDLDSQYFLRGRMIHKIIDADDRFTTGYDMKFAKIMAHENFRKYLLTLMEGGQQAMGEQFGLKWTGKKSALIELLYALHASNVLNKGNADIKVIAEALESVFSISLGNFYRKFQDFKFRKVNPTMFLDELKTNLIRRIDESDS